ncbi:MAG: PfkB family carbohydrate kinase [bacterium]
MEPGGSESNVAINLANLGNDIEFITKLPDNVVGDKIIRYLKKYGVKTNNIIKGGEKIGVYWTEHGIGPRASNVTYDRENSSIITLEINEFNFSKLLDKFDWFHGSGITPALSENNMKILKKLLDEANKKNIKTSVDLNYRSKLWK